MNQKSIPEFPMGKSSSSLRYPGLSFAPTAARAALRGRTACVTGASRGIGKAWRELKMLKVRSDENLWDKFLKICLVS